MLQYSQENPELEETYKEKIAQWDAFNKLLEDRQNVVNEIDRLTDLMDKVEAELASHSKGKYSGPSVKLDEHLAVRMIY